MRTSAGHKREKLVQNKIRGISGARRWALKSVSRLILSLILTWYSMPAMLLRRWRWWQCKNQKQRPKLNTLQQKIYERNMYLRCRTERPRRKIHRKPVRIQSWMTWGPSKQKRPSNFGKVEIMARAAHRQHWRRWKSKIWKADPNCFHSTMGYRQ